MAWRRSGSDSPWVHKATLAQLVEQCFRKAKVPGSNPGGGSREKAEHSWYTKCMKEGSGFQTPEPYEKDSFPAGKIEEGSPEFLAARELVLRDIRERAEKENKIPPVFDETWMNRLTHLKLAHMGAHADALKRREERRRQA